MLKKKIVMWCNTRNMFNFTAKYSSLNASREKNLHVKNEQRTQKNYKISLLDSEAFSWLILLLFYGKNQMYLFP